ncbi:F-box domain, Leucine-rich repeat domain, L domain-like protein [Artemisia annua]|uniref:F-box domain, Leucine-rich repeat domain, L domain-like protein n=1 Tax=Artemisia annua TaxID=35608 RepID=A0A2U1N497_ARTAN|nr:F-box domain, Leucine-rich repeat domain, L domain-like protein [Artemisia annua]
MDSYKKKMNVESDRLSNLPDDLIHKILSFNDTVDAIGMSSLSSRWKYIWKSTPCLDFSSDDFSTLRMFSKYIKNVLSGRDNERDVSSVKLKFRGKSSQVFVKKILNYAFSHNVQQLTVIWLIDNKIDFPLSLFSSQSLKHLTLKKIYCGSHRGLYMKDSTTLTSMWELPALTTLHLDGITLSDENADIISKCLNLMNLMLSDCTMIGSNGFNICHSRLSNLKIEVVDGTVKFVRILAPELKNLSIKGLLKEIQISAPDLVYLLLVNIDFMNFSADDFHSLEKVDICKSYPFNTDPHKIVGLLQRLHSVKSLTLNMEILEHLSSSVEVISHQPSPFANLKSLKIYPKRIAKWELPKEIVDMSIEVKNYLLDGSPSAAFTMISREETIEEMNATSAKKHMAELRELLQEEKANIKANTAQMEEGKTQVENQLEIGASIAHIKSCFRDFSVQIEQRKAKLNKLFVFVHLNETNISFVHSFTDDVWYGFGSRTHLPCLDFSSDDFSTLRMFSKYIKNVLSGRDNERDVSFVKLKFRGKSSQVFVKKILNYAFSHNVQQLTVIWLIDNKIDFPLSLFSSQSLKHLTLKKIYCGSHRGLYMKDSTTLTSMWELPALTTLRLDGITLSDENADIISKCLNLKNLTLSDCTMIGSNGFNICHSRLSNLKIEDVDGTVKFVRIVAPELKNLSIKGLLREIQISAPDLVYVLLVNIDIMTFSADDFHSLEKVDICKSYPFNTDPHKIVGLLQRLHSVKSLTLNLEILELLSSSVEVISHQPSPFANLKSLKIYPKRIAKWELPKERVDMSIEVKNYLLDGSPSAAFTMISREETIEEMNATSAKKHMAELRELLQEEKANIKANTAQMEEGKTQVENQLEIGASIAHIKSCFRDFSVQIEQRKAKVFSIINKLESIEELLTKLPTSNRVMIQPCFSSLCAEANIVISKLTDCMKIHCDDSRSRLSICFDELATSLEPSS